MSVLPAYSGEVLLEKKEGDHVEIMCDRDTVSRLSQGRMYMAVFIEVDSEGIAKHPESTGKRWAASNQAAMLCEDCDFAAYTSSLGRDSNHTSVVAFLRNVCGIITRAELDRDDNARFKFEMVQRRFWDWKRSKGKM
jgi:hypothetical protein